MWYTNANRKSNMKNMPTQSDPFLPAEGVKVIAACPLCHVRYEPLQAHVIDQRDDAHLLHLACSNCGGAVVAAVRRDALGVSSVGVVSDLTSDDVVRFKDAPTFISTDDILELHGLLVANDRSLVLP